MSQVLASKLRTLALTQTSFLKIGLALATIANGGIFRRKSRLMPIKKTAGEKRASVSCGKYQGFSMRRRKTVLRLANAFSPAKCRGSGASNGATDLMKHDQAPRETHLQS
jgi:hypothetical protein